MYTKMSLRKHISTNMINSKDYMVEPLTSEDWVLAFFYAGPERDKRNPEISGTLMLTKQFFVFIKEM